MGERYDEFMKNWKREQFIHKLFAWLFVPLFLCFSGLLFGLVISVIYLLFYIFTSPAFNKLLGY